MKVKVTISSRVKIPNDVRIYLPGAEIEGEHAQAVFDMGNGYIIQDDPFESPFPKKKKKKKKKKPAAKKWDHLETK